MARTRVGLLRITLWLPWARSRKDRRRVIRSLSDRLRARCLVAVAETGDPEGLREAELSVVAVGLGEAPVRARLAAAREIAVRAFPAEIRDAEVEWSGFEG